jgi:prepilin-type N-terminal cleavage/methylation domain-containing protein/prepilin-type processing-associated H-X9-DG protein
MKNAKKAFTLLELLVVIGILGLLMSVLVVSVTGGTESARAAECMSNLSSLAKAVSQQSAAGGGCTLAGSVETLGFDESQGIRNVKKKYGEKVGWISWNSSSRYAHGPSSHTSSAGWFTSAYDQDQETRIYCLTNGSLWKYLGGSESIYRCPNHIKKFPKKRPNWSYVMNSLFGWDQSMGSESVSEDYRAYNYGELPSPERHLLFAELQWENYINENPPKVTASSGKDCDCILQYRSEDGGEMIGFNHKSGRDVVAHVAFADGHVDRIVYPKQGLGGGELRNLTEWLCEGKDYTFDGQRYRELK